MLSSINHNSLINSSVNSSINSSINSILITNEYFINTNNSESVSDNIKKIKQKYNIIIEQLNSLNINKIK